jgi:hypothetical protein
MLIQLANDDSAETYHLLVVLPILGSSLVIKLPPPLGGNALPASGFE